MKIVLVIFQAIIFNKIKSNKMINSKKVLVVTTNKFPSKIKLLVIIIVIIITKVIK